ncbi:MAG: DUF11 domain-containing protein [Flavobacteriales bacterium]|nr:DUF11 domain-containing protein [Flavobacteriales bacterium]
MSLRSLFALLVLLSSVARGQYVIPDAILAVELQSVVPDAMNGNVLDTTHASVLSLNFLDLGSSDVTDLDGLRFFTGLDSLSIRFTPLTALTDLPGNLKWLDCSGADLPALPNDLPAGLESLVCAYMDLTALPITLPSTLLRLDAPNNELTMLSGLPASLKYLDVNWNNLVYIQELPVSLIELRCQSNNLSTLPPLPSGLTTISAGANALTSLPALPPGLQFLILSYNELVTLPALPDSLIELYIPSNQVTSLPELPAGLRKLSAGFNELTSLPALPDSIYYLYIAWNQIDGLPTLPGALTILGCSGNLLTELPPLPHGLEELNCNGNPITCLPPLPAALMDLVCSSTDITCLPNIPAGSAYTQGDLGFVPVVCGPDDDCFLTQVITGVLFIDGDGDGLMSSGELALPHGTAEAQPGTFLGGADGTGRFAIPVDTGTYSVQGVPELYHSITTAPYSITISMGTSDTTAYIGYQPIPGIHDLMVDIQAGVARPGFDNNVFLTVTNIGTESSDATLNLDLDADQEFLTSTQLPASQTGTNVSWNASLAPGESWNEVVTLHTDTSVALGTEVEHLFSANSAMNDTTPADNSMSWNDTVAGAYDPNDKRPSAHMLSPDQVQQGEWIRYTIRFQNTGTFLAEQVVITDTLSPFLQWNTVAYISASHDNQWVMKDGVLSFSFNNIQLPDSGADPLGSQGYVHFRVTVDAGVSLGDSIVNRANIFFDHNVPVITGPAITVINDITGLSGPDQPEYPTAMIVPNPASDRAVLHHAVAPGQVGVFILYSVTGKVVLRTNVPGGTRNFPFSTADLEPGMYFFVVTVGADKYGTGKLSVVR